MYVANQLRIDSMYQLFVHFHENEFSSSLMQSALILQSAL